MRRRLLLVLLFVTSLATMPGCLVVSLSPIYDEGSIDFDDSLLGVWENEDDRVTLEVSKREWKSYGIVWRDGFGAQEFTGHLTRIGKDRLMDVTPAAGVDRGALVISAHGFCRIAIDGDALSVEPLDYDFLSAPAQRFLLPTAQSAMDERQNLVLTGSTTNLRSWIQRQSARPKIFGPAASFNRKRTTEP